MPYIDKKDRKSVRTLELQDVYCYDPGDLNFAITVLITNYINRHGEKYKHYNDIIGALECAKLEAYRRMVASYEDIKISQNGDIEEMRRVFDARDFPA